MFPCFILMIIQIQIFVQITVEFPAKILLLLLFSYNVPNNNKHIGITLERLKDLKMNL